jgi:hypothetical protein
LRKSNFSYFPNSICVVTSFLFRRPRRREGVNIWMCFDNTKFLVGTGTQSRQFQVHPRPPCVSVFLKNYRPNCSTESPQKRFCRAIWLVCVCENTHTRGWDMKVSLGNSRHHLKLFQECEHVSWPGGVDHTNMFKCSLKLRSQHDRWPGAYWCMTHPDLWFWCLLWIDEAKAIKTYIWVSV